MVRQPAGLHMNLYILPPAAFERILLWVPCFFIQLPIRPGTVASMLSPRLVMLLTVAASLSVAAVSQDPKRCSTTGNYTDGSQYEQNLESLVSTLSTTAAANGNDGAWFDSDSVGTAPDRAWGLIMCYADRSATQCLDCLRKASLGLLNEVCPGHSRNLSVIYDDGGCLLRYADAPFFGAADTFYWLFFWVTAYVNVTDAARMNETRWRLLSDLVERAAGNNAAGGALRPMSGDAKYTDARGEEQVLYGLVQCTRDLQASECARCLVLARTLLSEHKDLNSSLAGSAKGFSCYVRYQLNHPIQVPPQPQGSGAAPPLGSEDGHTEKNDNVQLLFVLVGIGLAVAVFVACVKCGNDGPYSLRVTIV